MAVEKNNVQNNKELRTNRQGKPTFPQQQDNAHVLLAQQAGTTINGYIRKTLAKVAGVTAIHRKSNYCLSSKTMVLLH